MQAVYERFTGKLASLITVEYLWNAILKRFAYLKMDRLLLYWNCESSKENILRDVSGRGWNAEIKAGKWEWVQGKHGMGIRLRQAYAQVDGNIIESIKNTGEITVMLWMVMIHHAAYGGLVAIKPIAGGCCPYRILDF